MQDLVKSLEKTITKSIELYIQRIADHYDNTDKKTLLSLWNGNEVETENSYVNKTKTSELKTESITEGCPYKSTKGKNSGKVCGVKPKDGGTYCATHKKYEGKSVPEKKVIPQPKKSNSQTSPPAKEVQQRVFRKHKTLDKLYHPETDLVIKSAQDRVVVGKIVKDAKSHDKVATLNPEDIELCKQWGFQYESTDENKHNVNKDFKAHLSDAESISDVEELSKKYTKLAVSDEEEVPKKKEKSKKEEKSRYLDTEEFIEDIEDDLPATVVKKALGIENESDEELDDELEEELIDEDN